MGRKKWAAAKAEAEGTAMPDRATLEQASARARDEVRELEAQFGAEYGPLPERPALRGKTEVPKHQPWNRHCPGSVALTVLGGTEFKLR